VSRALGRSGRMVGGTDGAGTARRARVTAPAQYGTRSADGVQRGEG
jgi:hypothetical protein